MPELLEIIEKLQDTHGEIVRLDESIRVKGEPLPSILLMLDSMKKIQEILQTQFDAMAHTEYLDVCRYELFPQSAERPTLAGIGKTLLDFQDLFTQVYDAVSKRI